jgi:hypothetical protein
VANLYRICEGGLAFRHRFDHRDDDRDLCADLVAVAAESGDAREMKN